MPDITEQWQAHVARTLTRAGLQVGDDREVALTRLTDAPDWIVVMCSHSISLFDTPATSWRETARRNASIAVRALAASNIRLTTGGGGHVMSADEAERLFASPYAFLYAEPAVEPSAATTGPRSRPPSTAAAPTASRSSGHHGSLAADSAGGTLTLEPRSSR